MKLETILDAMEEAYDDYIVMGHVNNKRRRQYRAFRARILRMYDAAMAYVEESDDLIVQHYDNWQKAKQRIAELEAESENWRVSFHEAIIQLQAALEDIEKKDKELSDEISTD